ncbi:hypothetical protein [Candidatus Tisiphia endosymbiont of Nemotelus uliginosus]
MNWLFNFILNNNFLKKFLPKRDVDPQLSKAGQDERKPADDYYDHLGNPH